MELAARVEKNQLSEKDYRGLKDVLSYSAIKSFDTDREKFYREFVLGNPRKESESTATLLGSLVHCFLAEQKFEDKFHMLSAIEPSGQMKELADALFARTLIGLVDGVQSDSFLTVFGDAVQKVKYDEAGKEVKFKGKDLEKILVMFEGSDAELYYKELLLTIGKSPVSVSLITKAEQIVSKLRGHSYTYEYANARSQKGIDVFNELTIQFKIGEVLYKSMIDKTIVDHENKTIQPIDWKTSWDSEEPQRAYLKFGYYIQAGLYDYALRQWAVEHNLSDYEILPMIYIFCDTTGFADPTVLKLTKADLDAAWKGFSVRGYRYRGIAELINDIAWHVESGIWSTSYEMHLNKGVVKLDIDYDTSN